MSPWLSDLVLRSQSDERLVSLARAGYDRAFVAIFERYKGKLTAFALRLGVGGRTEDVVQQAFLSAFAALRDQHDVRHLSGWLHQIVRNAAVETVGRVRPESALDAESCSGMSTEEQVESRLEAQALLSNLAQLPERQRDALIRTTLEGQSRSQVALSMGLSEGAVRQLVHRARASLRAATAAVLPFPIVAWAARRGGRAIRTASAGAASRSLGGAAGSASSQVGSIAAGVASAGGGLVVKAGAIIAATGLVATGIAIGHGGHRRPSDAPEPLAATSLMAQASPRRVTDADVASHRAIDSAARPHESVVHRSAHSSPLVGTVRGQVNPRSGGLHGIDGPTHGGTSNSTGSGTQTNGSGQSGGGSSANRGGSANRPGSSNEGGSSSGAGSSNEGGSSSGSGETSGQGSGAGQDGSGSVSGQDGGGGPSGQDAGGSSVGTTQAGGGTDNSSGSGSQDSTAGSGSGSDTSGGGSGDSSNATAGN